MNHTVTTEFVLLGHSDDPDIHIVIFLFLFITYVLSVTGKPDYNHPNLGGLPSPDAHVSLPPKFLFIYYLIYIILESSFYLKYIYISSIKLKFSKWFTHSRFFS